MRLRIVLLCGMVMLASPIAAQTDAPSIEACVADSGRVRIVEPGAACKKRERSLAWAAAGPTGPQGPPGDPGPTGAAQPDCRVVARLTLPGINGEGAGGSMDVVAYTAGVDPSSDPAGGPPETADVKTTKGIDAASPQLFTAAVQGTPFPSATLEVLGPGGVVALRYSLTAVLVASVHQGVAAPCSLDRPFEEVTLAFGTIAASPGP